MEVRIAFIDREESYTSKASLLDFDDIPTYSKNNKEKYTFSGRRIHRGLYKSKDGTLINADVNGAGNTIRKEYPDAFKGVDMTYLYKTTKVVKYTDLYSSCNPSVVQEKHKVKKEHSHKPSPLSRTTKYYRWDKKIALMQTFDSYKKVYRKVKKAS
jgi:putative transposase